MASTSSWRDRDTTPGYLLVAATVISFLLLNGPLAESVHSILHDGFATLPIGGVRTEVNLHLIINDGLMVVFFLYVGLELKRETVEGPFKNPRQALLPIVGAAGGMAAPALIYLAIAGSADPAYARGWAIPAATDIAFAVGALSLLGSRVPPGLRLFLLALAIIDDLGAIIVIALFYTDQIVGWALGGAVLTFLAMLGANRAGVKALPLYWLMGVILWAFMLLSGVHATVAGVLTAVAIPMRTTSGGSPLIIAEHALKPVVQLAIMPIFAIANAGVSLSGISSAIFIEPLTLGVALGLFIGKPLGVALPLFIVAGFAHKILPAPPLATFGAACLAGVGFTMSLFIGSLAFAEGMEATQVRIGVIVGSIASAALGVALIALSARGNGDPDLAADELKAEQEGVLNAR